MVTHMKTTVELPDELLHQVQQLARDQGTTFKSLLEEGLRVVIERHQTRTGFTLRDASVSGHGLRPELRDAGWATLRELIYQDQP